MDMQWGVWCSTLSRLSTEEEWQPGWCWLDMSGRLAGTWEEAQQVAKENSEDFPGTLYAVRPFTA